MFGTSYRNSPGAYWMEFKTGKDGVNDTPAYLNFNQLYGRMTPRLLDGKKVILLDLWDFYEEEARAFGAALENCIIYYLCTQPSTQENYKTSWFLKGALVNARGKPLLNENGGLYQIAGTFTITRDSPQLQYFAPDPDKETQGEIPPLETMDF